MAAMPEIDHNFEIKDQFFIVHLDSATNPFLFLLSPLIPVCDTQAPPTYQRPVYSPPLWCLIVKSIITYTNMIELSFELFSIMANMHFFFFKPNFLHSGRGLLEANKQNRAETQKITLWLFTAILNLYVGYDGCQLEVLALAYTLKNVSSWFKKWYLFEDNTFLYD